MTHSPPIPPGNTSPYPLTEPPLAKKTAAPPSDRPVRTARDADTPGRIVSSRWLYAGAIAAVGAIAGLALALSGSTPKPSADEASGGKRRKPRKRAD